MDDRKGIKDSLLGGFSPLLAKLKERAENRKKMLRALRDSFFTWKKSDRRHTKKPISRAARRRKNKAARQARKMNRRKGKRPKGY